jgi:hypothetical protein
MIVFDPHFVDSLAHKSSRAEDKTNRSSQWLFPTFVATSQILRDIDLPLSRIQIRLQRVAGTPTARTEKRLKAKPGTITGSSIVKRNKDLP